MQEAEFEKLRQHLFKLQPLSMEEWGRFAQGLRVKHLHKGDCLIGQGLVENHIHYLNNGAARSYFLKDGKDYTLDFLFEGDFASAYFSFVTRKPSPVCIELLEDAQLIAISYSHLNSFYEHSPAAQKIGRLMAEWQYVKRLEKEMDLLSSTAEQRYIRLMEKNPQLIQSVSVKHLSSYLGIQPESLSRIRKLYSRN